LETLERLVAAGVDRVTTNTAQQFQLAVPSSRQQHR